MNVNRRRQRFCGCCCLAGRNSRFRLSVGSAGNGVESDRFNVGGEAVFSGGAAKWFDGERWPSYQPDATIRQTAMQALRTVGRRTARERGALLEDGMPTIYCPPVDPVTLLPKDGAYAEWLSGSGDAVRGGTVAIETTILWDEIQRLRLAGGDGVQARVNAAVVRSFTASGGRGLTTIHALYGAQGGLCAICGDGMDWALPHASDARLIQSTLRERGASVHRVIHIRCRPVRPPRPAREPKRPLHQKHIPKGGTAAIVAARDMWTCWLCHRPVDPKGVGSLEPTMDHVIPKSLGGKRTPANLRLAHAKCNRDRGNGPAETFRPKRMGAKEEAQEAALDARTVAGWLESQIRAWEAARRVTGGVA